jgi:dTDP-4-dehydrorhamnose reductase
MPMKRLLITGASGFLGWNLCKVAKKQWTVFDTVFSHSVDILDVALLQVDLTKFERYMGILLTIYLISGYFL